MRQLFAFFVVVIGLIMTLAPGVKAQQSDFDRGCICYEAGDYRDALGSFRAAADKISGLGQDSELSLLIKVNLAHTSYQLGHYAEALLHYERARIRDADNLELKSAIRETESRLGFERELDDSLGGLSWALRERFSVTSLVAQSVLGQMLLIGFAFATRHRRRRFIATLAAIILLVLSLWVLRRDLLTPGPTAIVLQIEIALRAEPQVDRPAHAQLRAGSRVEILESSDRWLKVRSKAGLGWIKANSVGRIVN
ncbi:MAG: SH3 domain-containing protein [Planctomycetota bacterium]